MNNDSGSSSSPGLLFAVDHWKNNYKLGVENPGHGRSSHDDNKVHNSNNNDQEDGEKSGLPIAVKDTKKKTVS